jgi:hypothetical protein
MSDNATADLIGPLEALASELAARGFAARVSTARHPCVRVVNRQATILSELIYAAGICQPEVLAAPMEHPMHH